MKYLLNDLKKPLSLLYNQQIKNFQEKKLMKLMRKEASIKTKKLPALKKFDEMKKRKTKEKNANAK